MTKARTAQRDKLDRELTALRRQGEAIDKRVSHWIKKRSDNMEAQSDVLDELAKLHHS